MIYLKSKEELNAMARSGRVVAKVFQAMEGFIRPGITTADIDLEVKRIIEGEGAIAAFRDYGDPPFPGHCCISVDEEVVHGIGRPDRMLEEGSVVSVDVGALLDGWYSDACRTFAVGKISPEIQGLLDCCERAFWKGFEQAKIGNRLGDIQAAIQAEALAGGYGIVKELTGHGVGRSLHEDPSIPNYGRAGHGVRLEEGMVFAVEPMFTLGSARIGILDDEWTIVTQDGKAAAHYENTFAITKDGPRILTCLE